MAEAHIDIERSYSEMLKCTRQFLDFYNCSEHYKEIDGEITLKLSNLSVWFQTICEEKLNIYCTFILDDSSKDYKFIYPAVWHDGSAMDWVYVIFYAEPCNTLPKEAAQVYKEWLGWLSDALGIGPGIMLNMDNFWLDSILSFYEELELEEEEKWKWEVSKKYKEGGEYQTLFQEIDSIKISVDVLTEHIEACRKQFYDNEGIVSLMECLYDGIEIASRMRVSWWCFSPNNDGFPDEYGEYGSDDVLIPLSTAILYSPSDGITMQMEESLNCEYSSGSEMCGWNRALFVAKWNMKRDKLQDFEDDRDSCRKFAVWTSTYMKAIDKWITKPEDV